MRNLDLLDDVKKRVARKNEAMNVKKAKTKNARVKTDFTSMNKKLLQFIDSELYSLEVEENM